MYRNLQQSALILTALLARCGPAAIFWAVIAIRVNPINGMIIARARTHIRQKRLEIAIPTVAYSYSSAAPILVVLVALAVATALYSEPCFIFSACVASALASMFCYCVGARSDKFLICTKLFCPLSCQTAARASASISNIGAIHRNLGAAITQANPKRATIFGSLGLAKDKKSGESLASYVDQFHIVTYQK